MLNYKLLFNFYLTEKTFSIVSVANLIVLKLKNVMPATQKKKTNKTKRLQVTLFWKVPQLAV